MVSYSHLSLLTDVCILEGCLTRIVIYFYYYALLLCFLSGRLTTSAFAGYDEFYVFEHFTGRKITTNSFYMDFSFTCDT